ncbi:MAG: DUF547 domain-containing protein [Candidatus Competibacteraceae bacterium]
MTSDPKAAWARVLARHVDEQGRIDFVGVSTQPQDLEAWVAYVGQVSPRSNPALFPSRNEQLAYYIDAYNGLAMYGVIRSGAIPRQKIRFFVLRKYRIGGEDMSLYAFENDVIRPYGDARIHFALNCMVKGCPRLPQVPWDPQQLDEQLQQASVQFFNSPYNVLLDDANRRVYLSELMDFYQEDYLSEAPTLIDFVNQYREQPIPTDYEVEFIPYNWKLRKQPRE